MSPMYIIPTSVASLGLALVILISSNWVTRNEKIKKKNVLDLMG